LAGWGPVALRVIAGIIFAYAGWTKFGDLDGVVKMFADSGIPLAGFSAYLVATIELVGGIALIAGLWTHLFAKLLGIIMIVAAGLSLKGGFMMAALPLALLAVCFSLFTTGGGKYSMDK
jgi:uncharacterized membrane protein YphA (DoxX/SURF4 family)